MSQLIKKIILIFSAVVFVLFIALLVGAWQLGAFSAVAVTLEEREPVFYLRAAKSVPYAQLPDQLAAVRTQLADASLSYKDSGALIYSDPAVIPLNELEARAVFLISDSLAAPPGLILGRFDAGPVLSAAVDANPTVAFFKVYPARSDWLAKHRARYRAVYPLLELYRAPLFTIQTTLVPQESP
jgi:hypothetical protein